MPPGERAETIDDAVDLLGALVARWADEGDRNGFFAALYRQVTLAIRNQISTFDDPARMSRFDAAFANRYLDAVDTGLGAGPADRTPRCWSAAFERALDDDLVVMQHLLLGINAHINLDLAFAAAVTEPGPAIRSLEHDYLRVNAILAAVVDQIQAALNRFSPMMALVDGVGRSADEAIMRFSIVRARDEAWDAACRLATAADDETPDQVGTELDDRATLIAERVLTPLPLTWLLWAVRRQESPRRHGFDTERELNRVIITTFNSVVPQL